MASKPSPKLSDTWNKNLFEALIAAHKRSEWLRMTSNYVLQVIIIFMTEILCVFLEFWESIRISSHNDYLKTVIKRRFTNYLCCFSWKIPCDMSCKHSSVVIVLLTILSGSLALDFDRNIKRKINYEDYCKL